MKISRVLADMYVRYVTTVKSRLRTTFSHINSTGYYLCLFNLFLRYASLLLPVFSNSVLEYEPLSSNLLNLTTREKLFPASLFSFGRTPEPDREFHRSWWYAPLRIINFYF